MSRLIDADVLIVKAHQESKGMSYPYREDFGLLVEWIADKTPAVQPQPEIIRCCKCVYWQQNTVRQNSNDAGWWNEALCEKHTIYGNEPHEAWVDADWYCADAERRADGSD